MIADPADGSSEEVRADSSGAPGMAVAPAAEQAGEARGMCSQG